MVISKAKTNMQSIKTLNNRDKAALHPGRGTHHTFPGLSRAIGQLATMSCTYILVVNISYLLDVYSSCMFYIVLCIRSMNYIVVFTSF